MYRRPWRDQALVFLLPPIGLRRDAVVLLNLDQVEPHTAAGLRRARRATVTGLHGKAKSQRTVLLSADARAALADYLEKERATDATEAATALLLGAQGPQARREDGPLSVRAINRILEW